MPSRRSFIAFGAAGSALVAIGAGAYRVTRRPLSATGPWDLAGPRPADVRLDSLRHAILAPNPHNLQPWLFRLSGADTVVVEHDPHRRLPATDPFDRQITIGFGGLIEIARMAGAARGFGVEVTPFPAGDAGPRLDGRAVAILRYVPDATIQADPLFAAVRHRRSTKEPYDLARIPPVEVLGRLAGGREPETRVETTADPARLGALRRLVLDAGAIEASTAQAHLESVRLMRIGHAEIDAAPDGIDLQGPLVEALSITGGIDRRSLADPASQAYQAGLDSQREIYGSLPAALWIVTPGNSRRDQLAAGRAYLRANLRATLLGLALHPASQALQEYPEMAEARARAGRLLAPGGGRVQMIARLGYGPPVPPSPRWPLEAKLA